MSIAAKRRETSSAGKGPSAQQRQGAERARHRRHVRPDMQHQHFLSGGADGLRRAFAPSPSGAKYAFRRTRRVPGCLPRCPAGRGPRPGRSGRARYWTRPAGERPACPETSSETSSPRRLSRKNRTSAVRLMRANWGRCQSDITRNFQLTPNGTNVSCTMTAIRTPGQRRLIWRRTSGRCRFIPQRP